MTRRRWVLVALAAIVVVLAIVFLTVDRSTGERIAWILSAVATVAAVGVLVPDGRSKARPRIRVSRTGAADGGTNSIVNTGVTSSSAGQPSDVVVDRTGSASTGDGGVANSGFRGQ